MNLFTAARPFYEAVEADPGTSDLDNEQPLTITVTLGDWRKLGMALHLAGERSEYVKHSVTRKSCAAEFTPGSECPFCGHPHISGSGA